MYLGGTVPKAEKRERKKYLPTTSILGVILAVILVFYLISQFRMEEMQFTDMTEELSCVVDEHNEYVINSEEEYAELLNHKISAPQCTNFQLPPIDFSQHTLLGKYAFGGGCSVKFERKVYRDEANKRIIFFIKVNERGSCEMIVGRMNWVLIRKIPSDYRGIFKVERRFP